MKVIAVTWLPWKHRSIDNNWSKVENWHNSPIDDSKVAKTISYILDNKNIKNKITYLIGVTKSFHARIGVKMILFIVSRGILTIWRYY